MEADLDVYPRPSDLRFPRVCLDETSRHLLGDVTPPRPVAPGQPARHDDEYVREGVVNLFLVMDILNIHRPASLSEPFAPAEAKRLADKREIHSTPKHGSWLNMAEQWFGILTRKRLRHPDFADLGALADAIAAFIALWNTTAHPFRWTTASFDKVIRKAEVALALPTLPQASA